MQFTNRKHQCYIVGEGSFVGNAGQLSTLVEDEKDDFGALGSMKKSRSVFSLSPSTELQVTVEVEPTVNTDPYLASTTRLTSSASKEKKFSFEDARSAVRPSKSPRRVVGDEVISEDGMLQT